MATNPQQPIEGKQKSLPRRKRVAHLQTPLRKQLPTLFDMVADDESLARSVGISRMDLHAELIRDLRGKGPNRETNAISPSRSNVIPFRRSA